MSSGNEPEPRGRAATVAIVTDSTAGLTAGEAANPGGVPVRVVPLQILVGPRAHRENIDIGAGDVARELKAGSAVSTSRPSPAHFAEVYRELFAGGVAGIVSVHLSGALSGTVDAARLAAAELGAEGLDVRVVDSETAGAGLGYSARCAAAAALSGGDSHNGGAPAGLAPGELLDAVAGAAESAARERNQTFFYVDTLEFLRRGGRVGSASSWFGAALSIKPLLRMHEGRIEPMEKVRTSARAISRLKTITLEAAAGYAAAAEGRGRSPRVGYCVQHLDAPARAREVLDELLTGPVPCSGDVREISAVLGAHVGPGMLAITVMDESG